MFKLRKLAGYESEVNLHKKEGFASISLYNEIALQPLQKIDTLQNGFQWVIDNNIHCVLIGGSALANYIHGIRPMAIDIDFLTSDMPLVMKKIKEGGLAYRPLINMDLSGIQIPQFNVDFINASSGKPKLHQYVMKTAKLEKIGGVLFPVASPEALTIMKLDSNRDKDDNDAFALIKSGKINKTEYLKGIRILKNILGDFESMLLYADMIV